ncbi:MAG: HD domain-containing protein, partial [Clostridiales bacterium]|nr:HD domain-containing protein [Clostridiales bacterium]
MDEMITYFSGDAKRINHFLKVHSYAKLIMEQENIDSKMHDIIEIAALTHDIGIKVCEQKYNTCSEKYQEIMGPAVAKKLLTELGYDENLIERVCYLIGHHHTYIDIDGIDYQILIESDL